MSVTISAGGNENVLTQIRGRNVVGMSVGELLGDQGFRAIFNLTGRETVEVLNNAGNYNAVTHDYIMRENDVIALTAQAGTKG